MSQEKASGISKKITKKVLNYNRCSNSPPQRMLIRVYEDLLSVCYITVSSLRNHNIIRLIDGERILFSRLLKKQPFPSLLTISCRKNKLRQWNNILHGETSRRLTYACAVPPHYSKPCSLCLFICWHNRLQCCTWRFSKFSCATLTI